MLLDKSIRSCPMIYLKFSLLHSSNVQYDSWNLQLQIIEFPAVRRTQPCTKKVKISSTTHVQLLQWYMVNNNNNTAARYHITLGKAFEMVLFIPAYISLQLVKKIYETSAKKKYYLHSYKKGILHSKNENPQ